MNPHITFATRLYSSFHATLRHIRLIHNLSTLICQEKLYMDGKIDAGCVRACQVLNQVSRMS